MKGGGREEERELVCGRERLVLQLCDVLVNSHNDYHCVSSGASY